MKILETKTLDMLIGLGLIFNLSSLKINAKYFLSACVHVHTCIIYLASCKFLAVNRIVDVTWIPAIFSYKGDDISYRVST